MPAREAPQPPYVLLYEEAAPGMEPLLISIDDRPSLPLFDSATKAQAFLDSTDFGPDWRPVEVSGAGLLVALEACRDKAGYVALSPPPAGSGGMKVEMGRLDELIEALQASQDETDLFGLGGLDRG
jgi:hypothetical protein